MKRHVRRLEVILEPTVGFDQHFLDDIAGVKALDDGGIKAQVDHAPDRFAMSGEQLLDSVGVAGFSLIEQFLGIVGVGPHNNSRSPGMRYSESRGWCAASQGFGSTLTPGLALFNTRPCRCL